MGVQTGPLLAWSASVILGVVVVCVVGVDIGVVEGSWAYTASLGSQALTALCLGWSCSAWSVSPSVPKVLDLNNCTI